MQTIITMSDGIDKIIPFFESLGHKKALLVVGESGKKLEICKRIFESFKNIEVFSDFHPNPESASVINGIRLLREKRCTLIIALGGGSAIDVAKSIKICAGVDELDDFINRSPSPVEGIEMIAIPTTAGTGSESTHFSVIYHHGEKYSLSCKEGLPEYVILDPNTLESLSAYQRKSSMADALCHAVESYWSINSNERSKILAGKAIGIICHNYKSYLNNNPVGNERMLAAANIAGQAINLTKTTAVHAMSYKLTSLYGIAHGNAVGILLPKVWRYMLEHAENCVDARGTDYFINSMGEIAKAFECDTPGQALEKYEKILHDLDFEPIFLREDSEIRQLVKSVNIERLKNNPVSMNGEVIESIYTQLLKTRKGKNESR